MKSSLAQFDIDPAATDLTVVVGASWLKAFRQKFFALEQELQTLQASHAMLLKKNEQLSRRIQQFELNDRHLYIIDTLA